jgi:hypothetical protein
MHMMIMATICRLMAIMMVAVVLVYSWRCELLP